RVREVRHVKADEQGQPQAREPSCDARETLRIECRWQERHHITDWRDFLAGEISDAGDCLEEIARERVGWLELSAVDQQRSLVELRKRGNPVLFEVQRHGSRPARRRMPVEHVSDFGETAVELGSESWKLRHQPLTVELPHLRKTLPPALGRAG